MGPNYLKYEKQYSMGGSFNSPTLEQIKEDVLKQVLELPAVLGRGIIDHLIEYDGDTKLIWRANLLEQMDIGNLLNIKNIVENRKDIQQKTY